MNDTLGKLHFWISFVAINVVFMPMFWQGMAGVSRRLYDPTFYAHGAATQDLNVLISMGAWVLGAAQVLFILNFFASIFSGKKVTSDNPWEATTLEWATPTPPPHGNFLTPPKVYRGPYEYSVPGAAAGFIPQNQP